MKKLVFLVLIGMLGIPISYGVPNKKFFKKAADKVWSMNIPEFNAKTQIPDSLATSSSAVIIALYQNADVDLIKNASSNRTEEEIISRVMVKILDKSALDYFSTFEFDESKGKSIKVAGLILSEYKSAFGARIYKSDGRIIDVDTNEAYPVTVGKKKDYTTSYKLAIGGLEIGDVLEYFYYDENWVDEFSIRPIRFDFMKKYPTLSYVLSGDIHKDLTIEYRSYNGAPEIDFAAPNNNRRHFETRLQNIPASESGKGLLPERQNPFVKMFITNFTARLEYHPATSRNAGVYRNLMTGTVYRDILTLLRDAKYESSLPNKVLNLTKDFVKQHPDADATTIIDAAWLALNYYNYVDDKDEEDIWLAIMFKDIVDKLKLNKTASVAFLNSRDDVSTDQLISWRQPDYLCLVDDRYYLPGIECRLPGEIPGKYQGEEGGTFRGDLKATSAMIFPDIIKAPMTTPKQNLIVVNTVASIDGLDIKLQRNTVLSGVEKEKAEPAFYAAEWASDIENYLGIPENKRYKSKGDKEEHKKNMIKYLTEKIAIGPDIKPKVNNVEVVSRGITPDKPNVEYNIDCTIEGLISEAGNDMVLNVGKLFGDNYVLTDREKSHRENDYCFDAPQQVRYETTLQLPDGYTIKEGTLDDLNVNVRSLAGQYYTKATYNEENNTVNISVIERYARYMISAEMWQEVVTIFDTAAKFNSATLVLTHK
jgi:hypothetical protein